MYVNPDGSLRGYEDADLQGFFLFDAAKAVGKAVVGGVKKVAGALPAAAGGFIAGGPAGALAAGGAKLLMKKGKRGSGMPTPPAGTDPRMVASVLATIKALQARQQAEREVAAPAMPAIAGVAIPLALAAGVLFLAMRRR